MTTNEALRSRIVLLLFFLSGAAGLLYQVVWIRLFVHVFGATVLAVSTVLAAFMGGLAIGGLLGGRLVRRIDNPLLVYGALEIALALYAGAIPLLLNVANALYAPLYPPLMDSFWGLSAVRFLVSALILLPPTILMGATLPLLVAHAERTAGSAQRRVAHLYAINTFGAVCGTAGASFILLPELGLSRTLVSGVILNIVVGTVAVLLARGRSYSARPAAAGEATTVGRERNERTLGADERGELGPVTARIGRPLLLTTAGVLGFSALAFEVLWTRTLTLALGTTTYAFAIVLTVFLLGIASGSAAAGRLLRNPRLSARLFAFAPAAIGLLALAIAPFLDRLPDLFVRLSARGEGSWIEGLGVRFLLAGLPLFPPTFLSGAAFPLAVGIDRAAVGTSRSVGDVYASNTLGAILGSWLAGFVLIPLVGLRMGIEMAAVLPILASCAILFSWPEPRRRSSRAIGAALVTATLLLFTLAPEWNRSALTRGGFAVGVDLRRYGLAELAEDRSVMVFLEEGITSTITVRQWGRELTMQMNGVTEASNTGDLTTQVMVGGFGAILHEDPRDALVIGLGSGITTAAAARHPGVTSVECVEISEAVVHAAALFEDWNHGVLQDPRVRIVVSDGRNHLALSGREYDVIVSQLSNVWNSGIGSLMSTEFFALARTRLRPGGILCSWIQGYSLGAPELRSVLAAVRESFPTVSLWMAGWGDLVIIAGDEDFGIDVPRLLAKAQDPVIRAMLLESDSPDLPSLLSRNLLAGEFVDRYIAGMTPNSDDNMYLEFSAPKALHEETIRDLIEGLHRRAGGTESILIGAPPELVAQIPRYREARRLESIGRLAFRENLGEEGLAAVEEAYRLHPTAPSIADVLSRALNGRGETLARREDAGGAVAHYRRASEIDPAYGEPWASLARLYREAHQLDVAVRAVDEAIAREPSHPDHRALRAEILLARKEIEEAVEEARRCLELDARNHDAHVVLGQALSQRGELEAADAVYAAGLAFHPESEELGSLRRKLGKLEPR